MEEKTRKRLGVLATIAGTLYGVAKEIIAERNGALAEVEAAKRQAQELANLRTAGVKEKDATYVVTETRTNFAVADLEIGTKRSFFPGIYRRGLNEIDEILNPKPEGAK